jgi:hypothetical protein
MPRAARRDADMPTKRTRTSRRPSALSSADFQFLTGIQQPGANVFFMNALRSGKLLPRVRELIARHGSMIPAQRCREIDKLMDALSKEHGYAH